MPDKGKFEKQDIINRIIKMRTQESKGSKSILDYLMNELGYAQAQSYNYMREANETIKEIYETNNVGMVENTISELESVLEYARNTNNYKLWLEIKKEINKITGIYAPEKQKVEHIIKANFPDMNDGNTIN
jgi:hypothetical protein